jgi:hypothetical protein
MGDFFMEIAIAVIGHSRWGKSRTLKRFIGSSYKHKIIINGKRFYIKHMSNDDIFEKLYSRLKKFIDKNEIKYSGLIFALCPDFKTSKKKTKKILDLLKGLNIRIKFFVLKNNYENTKSITNSEIKQLEKYGNVHISDGTAEDTVRAKKLMKYFK